MGKFIRDIGANVTEESYKELLLETSRKVRAALQPKKKQIKDLKAAKWSSADLKTTQSQLDADDMLFLYFAYANPKSYVKRLCQVVVKFDNADVRLEWENRLKECLNG